MSQLKSLAYSHPPIIDYTCYYQLIQGTPQVFVQPDLALPAVL